MKLDGAAEVEGELQRTKSALEKTQQSLRIVGAAFTAVGAAGLKMVSDARKLNATLGATALNLGATTKEMRDLALSVTNVTFPLSSVVATFDLLARAGVEDSEIMKEVALAFDNLADATGSSAEQVTNNMIPAMKTFGLTAEEMADKVDMFTYLNRKTTLSLEDFNTMVGYTTPELVKMGLTVDDLAAAIIHMEKQGYAPGRVMTREFMKATTRAREQQIPLTEALGMTSAELEVIQGELAGATGMTQEYADAANTQYGIMAKLKQKFEEVSLVAGSFLTPLEPILAGMTALGPIMLIVATNTKIATIATHLFGAAWKTAMGPIGWAILGVTALVTAGILLWKNWDKVVHYWQLAWSTIKIVAFTAIDAVLGYLERFVSWIPGLGDRIREVRESFSNMIEVEKVKKDWEVVRYELEENTKALEENKNAIENTASAIDPELTGALIAEQEGLRETQSILEDQKKAYERLLEKAQDAVKQFRYERSEAGELGITTRNVTDALIKQGWTAERLADLWGQLGDDVNYADRYLAAVGKTAKDIIDILGIQIDKVDRLGESYRDTTEAIYDMAVAQMTWAERMAIGTAGAPTTAAEERSYEAYLRGFASPMGEAYQAFLEAKASGDQIKAIAMATLHPTYWARDLAARIQTIMEMIRKGYSAPIWETALEKPVWMQRGGLITTPTWLTRLGESIPYGIMAEKGPERISPINGGLIPGVMITGNNFYVRQDSDIDAIADRLVSKIRLRTGIRA